MFAIRLPRLLRNDPVVLRRARRGAATIVGALVVGLSSAHAADSLTAADRRAIESTLRMQLDAFGHDDADRAFGFAAPDIQRMFRSSDSFLEMVRDHYEPVYHPARVRFLRAERIDGAWTQPVQITDTAGKVWRALFTMRRQADRTWKVGGCQLVETSAIET